MALLLQHPSKRSMVREILYAVFTGGQHTFVGSCKHQTLSTRDEILDWMATTDAFLRFVGEPLTECSTPETMVVFCNHQTGDGCGGTCTVYSGSSGVCFDVPNTNCLRATTNVAFCNEPGCGPGLCNVFDSCGTVLNASFCSTPGTVSISILAP